MQSLEELKELMNEVVTVPVNSNNLRIHIRSANEAAYGNTVSNHGPSIKIKGGAIKNKNGIPIYIKAESYCGDEKEFRSEIKDKVGKYCNKHALYFIEAFIYRYQALLLMVWYTKCNSINDLHNAVEKYINSTISEITDADTIDPRTNAQLEDDKKSIIAYFTKELNEPNLEIKFER